MSSAENYTQQAFEYLDLKSHKLNKDADYMVNETRVLDENHGGTFNEYPECIFPG